MGVHKDKKLTVIVSPDDMVGGLLGISSGAIKGYRPEYAYELFRNILLFGHYGDPAKAAAKRAAAGKKAAAERRAAAAKKLAALRKAAEGAQKAADAAKKAADALKMPKPNSRPLANLYFAKHTIQAAIRRCLFYAHALLASCPPKRGFGRSYPIRPPLPVLIPLRRMRSSSALGLTA